MKLINFKHDYLTKNIITYIGNKRKLLLPLDDVVQDILNKNPNFNTCLDAFSGSGIVSRYFRYKGFKTYSNDLENYTVPINNAFLTKNTDPLTNEDYIFLNSIKSTTKPYFSKHYAPQDTENPDIENERLFYSRENAIFIDGVLEEIQDWEEKKKDAVLGSLLFKMSKHINTSGVMKGFHKGFGGPNQDNLTRILGKITIEPLSYIDAPSGIVLNNYAEKLFDEENLPEMDIVYLDPPYNGHQYSSNYHLLNSATNYDFYDPGSMHLPKNKVGIRKDHNRSDFCYKNKAFASFDKLFSTIKSKYIIMSYSTDGLLSESELIDLFKKYFKTVTVHKKDYKKYAGGYNGYSNLNKISVKELFFVVKC